MISNNVPTRRKDAFLPLAIHLPTSRKCAEESSVSESPALLLSRKQEIKNPEYSIRLVIIQTIAKYFVGKAKHKQDKKNDTAAPHPCNGKV